MTRARGTGTYNAGGYLVFNTKTAKMKYHHIQVAERALGRPLPAGAVVHHHDNNPANNDPTNLVICPSQAYHRMLHQRMASLDACGNPNWRKCTICKTYDAPENLYFNKSNKDVVHKACRNKAARDATAARRYANGL